MSSWEDRMAERYQARAGRGQARAVQDAEARRRAYLGEAFLPYYLPGDREVSGEPQVEIVPEVIAARCLGISYGDPGPKLPEGTCRQCWGERHVWLGNCWGVRHAGEPGSFPGCPHECHEGEVWLA